jgi:hypothetical protein
LSFSVLNQHFEIKTGKFVLSGKIRISIFRQKGYIDVVEVDHTMLTDEETDGHNTGIGNDIRN